MLLYKSEILKILPQVSEVTSSQNFDSYNNVTGGVDYAPGPYDVTISAGDTDVTLEMQIYNDKTLEPDETFNLSIDPTAQGTVGKIEMATVTIVDDDCELRGCL